MDTLLVGAFCAIAVREPAILKKLKTIVPYIAALCLLGMIWIEYFGHELRTRSAYTQTIGFSLLAFGFGALVLSAYLQNGSNSLLNRIVSWLPLRIFGKYSYGIYVYHILVFTIFFRFTNYRGWPLAFVMVLTSLVVAALSYELFEKQFLRLKNRFSPLRPMLVSEAARVGSSTVA